jgi:hypothetical protein
MHKDKSVSESSIALQIIIGLIIVILIYKFIDTKIIKWPLIIMIAGAFFYSILDDYRELKMNYLKHHLDTGEVPTLKDGIKNWLKAIFFLIIFIITFLFVFPDVADIFYLKW